MKIDCEHIDASELAKEQLAKFAYSSAASVSADGADVSDATRNEIWERFKPKIDGSTTCYRRVASSLIGSALAETDPTCVYKCIDTPSGKVVVEMAKRCGANDAVNQSDENSQWEVMQVWSTSKWHWPRHYWHWFFFDTRELYTEGDKNKRGIILGVIGMMLVLMRRLSFYENLKHVFPSITGLNQTPAWVLDAYLLTWWTLALGCIAFIPLDLWLQLPPWSSWIFLFLIVQIAQTCFYHEIWRTLRQSEIAIQRIVHSRLRNFVIGIANVLFVTTVFGIVYFLQFAPDSQRVFGSVFDGVYFSFTVAWSVGSADIDASKVSDIFKAVVIFQICTTLFLVSALLGILVGGIKPLPDSRASQS